MAVNNDRQVSESAGEAAATAPSKLDEALEAWFREKIQNSVVSQSTAVYNHVRAAVDDLKARLAKSAG